MSLYNLKLNVRKTERVEKRYVNGSPPTDTPRKSTLLKNAVHLKSQPNQFFLEYKPMLHIENTK